MTRYQLLPSAIVPEKPRLQQSVLTLARSAFLAVSLSLSLAASSIPVWAADATVEEITFSPKQGFLVHTSQPTHASLHTVVLNGNKRIILDITNAEIGGSIPRDPVLLEALSSQWPVIRNISVNQFGGTHSVVRILLDIQGGAHDVRLVEGDNNRIVLQFGSDSLQSVTDYQPKTIPYHVTATPNKVPLDDYQRALKTIETQQQTLENQQQQLQVAQDKIQNLAQRVEQEKNRQPAANLQTLQANLASLQRVNEQLTLENRRLKDEQLTTDSSATGLIELKERLSVARRELGNAIQTINQQNQEIQSLKEQLSHTETNLELSAKEQITLLNQKLDEKDTEIAALKAAANQQTSTSATSLDSMESLHTRLNQKDIQIANLHHQLEELKTLQGDAQGADKRTEEIKKALVVVNEKYTALQNENNQLREQLRSVSTQSQSGEEASKKLKMQVVELTTANKTLSETNQQLAQEKEKAQTQQNSLQQQLKEQTESIANLQEQVALNQAIRNTLVTMNEKYEALEAENKKLADQLQGNTQVKTQESRQQQEQLAALQQTVESLQTENNALKEQSQQLAKAQKELTDIQQAYENLNQEYMALSTNLDKIQTTLTAEKTTKDSEKARFTELNQKLTQVEQERDNSTQQLQSLKRELANHQQSENTLKQTLVALNQDYETLSARHAELQATIEKYQTDAETAKQDQAAGETLRAQNKALIQTADTLQKKLADNEAALLQLKDENVQLQNQVSQYTEIEQAIQRQEASHQKLASNNEELKHQIASLQDLLTSKDQALGELQAKLDIYQTSSVSEQEILKTLKAENSELNTTATQQSSIIRTLKDELAQLKSQQTKLSAQLDTQRKQNAALTQNTQQQDLFQKELGQLKETHSELHQRYLAALDTIKAKEKELADAHIVKQERVSSFDEQLQQLRTENQRLTELLSQKDTAYKTLVQSNDENQQQLLALTTANQELADTLNQLKQAQSTQAEQENMAAEQLNTLQQEKKTLTAKIQQLEKQHIALQKEKVQNPTEEYIQQINTLKDTNKTLAKDLEALEKNHQKVLNELADTRGKLAKASEAKHSDNSQETALKAEIEQLQTKLIDATANQANLTAQLSELRNRAQNTPAENSSEQERERIQTLEETVSSLMKQQDDLEKELTRKDEKVNELQKEISGKVKKSQVVFSDQAQKHYEQGQILEKNGKLNEAVAEYKQAVTFEPTSAKYVQMYSSGLIEQGNYEEALKVLTNLVKNDPANRESYNQLGKIYLLNNQLKEAQEIFLRAIPEDVLSNYATTLKRQGEYEKAETVLKTAITLSPNDSYLYFNLGNLMNTREKYAEAKKSYLQALKQQPDFPEAHYNLGLVYSKTGEPKSAVLHLEKFLELAPDSSNAEAVRNYIKELNG